MNILCSGPHVLGSEPVLGQADKQVTGLLCELCGIVYTNGVGTGTLGVSEIPDTNKVAKTLKDLNIPYDKTKYKPTKVG